MNKREMIKEFQCPGCVCGCDPDSCDRFELEERDYFRCTNHICGTRVFGSAAGGVSFALGMPVGFNRGGYIEVPAGDPPEWNSYILIRLYEEKQEEHWNKFNIPVWALEEDGYLFVRTFMPRINRCAVDVFHGMTMEEMKKEHPQTIDVGEFRDEID